MLQDEATYGKHRFPTWFHLSMLAQERGGDHIEQLPLVVLESWATCSNSALLVLACVFCIIFLYYLWIIEKNTFLVFKVGVLKRAGLGWAELGWTGPGWTGLGWV